MAPKHKGGAFKQKSNAFVKPSANQSQQLDTGASVQLTLAYGACSHPDCTLKARAASALERGEALPPASGEFVVVSCTSKSCTAPGKLHQVRTDGMP